MEFNFRVQWSNSLIISGCGPIEIGVRAIFVLHLRTPSNNEYFSLVFQSITMNILCHCCAVCSGKLQMTFSTARFAHSWPCSLRRVLPVYGQGLQLEAVRITRTYVIYFAFRSVDPVSLRDTSLAIITGHFYWRIRSLVGLLLTILCFAPMKCLNILFRRQINFHVGLCTLFSCILHIFGSYGYRSFLDLHEIPFRSRWLMVYITPMWSILRYVTMLLQL